MTPHTCIGDVSLKRALELLAEQGDPVKQSTLSRYVAKYADALQPKRRGKEIVINFETLACHRRENIRLEASGPGLDTAKTRQAATRSDEAAQNVRAQRLLRELELGERTGALTPKAEVEEAAHAAVAALKGALALALNDTSDQIAALAGVEARLIRPHLRAFEKKAMDAFVRALSDRGIDAPPKE